MSQTTLVSSYTMPAPPPLPAALPDISDDEAPPLPDREPPASPETLHGLARLYRLVPGRELSDRLAEAAALAPASAVDDAVTLLDLIRRGLKAYRDLKTRGAEKAAKFRVALAAKLKGLDLTLLELLQPAEPVEHKAEEPELVWHVLRTYRNKQQMSLRDSRMNVPEDHPSAADPVALVKLVEPLTAPHR